MIRVAVAIIWLLSALVCTDFAYSAASPPKMRPYSGIGVVILPGSDPGSGPEEPFHLYEEPGIYRRGQYSGANTSGNEWIFGAQRDGVPLIVTASKGGWLKVCYDDAGREAWIDLQRRATFQTWDLFLKSQISRVLPGLRKQYYQLYQMPDRNPLSVLTPKQLFKVLKLENDWAMIMVGQNTLGWLRWRDEDGRLLIGFGAGFKQ